MLLEFKFNLNLLEIKFKEWLMLCEVILKQ